MAWQADLALAVRAVFDQSGLERVLAALDKRLDTYSGPGPFPAVVGAVIAGAERESWARALVKEALWRQPSGLRAFRETHPDLAPTALRDSEISDLRIGLESAYRAYEDLARLVAQVAPETSLDAIVGRVTDAAPVHYVQRLIVWFDERGSVTKLVQLALAVRSDPVLVANASLVLAAIKTRETTVGYRQVDPVSACLINGHVFLDRQPLRTTIKTWCPNPPKPILAVNGPSRSGKTYSMQLMDHVAAQQKELLIASIDLTAEQHALFRPDAFARSLLYATGHAADLQFIPLEANASSPARWVQDLSAWLASIASTGDKTWVIALDGFFHPDLPELTRDMVREIVKRASRPGSPFRVALLHYSDDLLPMDIRRSVADEQLGALSRQELQEYLQRLGDQLGVAFDAGAISDIIDDVISKAPLTDIERVAAEIQRWHDELVTSSQTARGQP